MLERTLAAILAPCCTAALLACVPAASDQIPGAAPTSSPSSATLVSNSQAIAGQWDIVSFRGYEPARRLQGTGRAAYADFASDGVALHIGCNYSGAAGSVRAGRFEPATSDRASTLIGCEPARQARDEALFTFFDRGPSVEQMSDGRLRLTADDDVLILERPATRRLAFLPSPEQLMGEWHLNQITHYLPGGGITGIGLTELPGRLQFDGIEAKYTPCPQFRLRYRYAPEGRIEKLDGPPIPGQRQGCDALKAEPFGRDMPTPWDVLRVLHGNPLVELVDDQTILLSTERYGVLLTKRPPAI